MNKHSLALCGGTLAGVLLLFTPLATAVHPQMKTVAGDYTVYLGVVPAKRLAEYPDLVPHDHPLQSGMDNYHVEMAVIDRNTGQRVEDAEVWATLEALGLNARRKTMHRMEMAGAVTYCNYFRMQPGDHYTFSVDVRRPAWSKSLQLDIAYGQVMR